MYKQEETKYPRLYTFMEQCNLSSFMNNLLTFLTLLGYQTRETISNLDGENNNLILISQLVNQQNELFPSRILDRNQVYHSLTRLRDIKIKEKQMIHTTVKNEIGCTKFPETQILKLINDIDESTTDRNHIVTRLNNLLN
ncbi:MAG: hypothetical protein ACXADW_13720, partial [Candidatus Hodarchaeales archaeon]